jgi:uncharacterized protein (TIGR03435 family)
MHLHRILTLLAAASLALTVPTRAQSPITSLAAAPPPTFEVASIHPIHATDGHHHIYSSSNDSHFRTINLTFKELIQFAWNIPMSQIVDAPPWADSLTFDIDAKSSPETDAQMHDLPSSQGKLEKQQMVRALLADRFSLKAHTETRQLPVFSLVVANPKTGPKFKSSDANGTTIDSGHARIHVQGSDNTIALLARELAANLGRPVLDNTNLPGRFDLSLKWTPDDATAANPILAADAPPDIFTAIQDQLGLKLESTKAPVPVLVIDHAELPTEN